MPKNSTKQDEEVSARSKMATLMRLFRYMFDFKGTIIIVLLIMACTTTILLINPLLIEAAVNEAIPQGDTTRLIYICVTGAVLNLILFVLIKLRMYLMAKVSNQVLVNIRQELYEHIQTLDFDFFDSRPTGKILARIIGDVNSLKDVLSNCVTTLIPDAVTVIAVIVIMIAKEPKLALASMWSLPIMIVGVWLDQRKAHKCWQVFRTKNSNLNAFIHEDVAGIRVIQSFDAQKETQETFDGLIEEHYDSFRRACMYSDFFGPIVDICWAVGLIAMYYVGVKVVGADTSQIGTLIAFAYYIGMFWQPVMNLSNLYNQLVTNIAGAERIFEILDTDTQIKDGEANADLPDVQGSITFKNVSFHYDEDPNVLNDVSFEVKPGETIALVGPTGAGKSTIVNLISRFYDVQQGQVLVDGYDIKEVTVNSLRRQLGIMTQDNFLFTGTIRDNIRYGKLDATDEQIEAAAKAVNAHEFIMKLEKGYDTELQERGAGLSAGQRQLLAFARTMVSDPRILILDEATSSIDTHTEALVQKGIASLLKGRTSFVIAHRLSTIRNADRIFVVNHGGICEAGTHDELMAKKGEYYELIQRS